MSSGIPSQPVPQSVMLYPKVIYNSNGGRGFFTKVARSQSSLILLDGKRGWQGNSVLLLWGECPNGLLAIAKRQEQRFLSFNFEIPFL